MLTTAIPANGLQLYRYFMSYGVRSAITATAELQLLAVVDSLFIFVTYLLCFVVVLGITSCSPNPCRHGMQCVTTSSGSPYCKSVV